MSGLGMHALDAAWWPYLFILLAGGLATEIWRWIGVLAGDRLSEQSDLFLWVKCVATALVAAVIGKLVAFPTGSLEAVPLFARVAAAAVGWSAFRIARKNVLVGVLAGEAVLMASFAAFAG